MAFKKPYYNQNQNQNWNKSNNGYQQQQPQQKKRSGAKTTMATDKDGNKFMCVVAWKVSKSQGGIIKMIGSARKKDYECSNGSERWVCKVTLPFGKAELYTGFWNPQTKKLRIPDLNLVASCNGGIGGYFGKSVFKPR